MIADLVVTASYLTLQEASAKIAEAWIDHEQTVFLRRLRWRKKLIAWDQEPSLPRDKKIKIFLLLQEVEKRMDEDNSPASFTDRQNQAWEWLREMLADRDLPGYLLHHSGKIYLLPAHFWRSQTARIAYASGDVFLPEKSDGETLYSHNGLAIVQSAHIEQLLGPSPQLPDFNDHERNDLEQADTGDGGKYNLQEVVAARTHERQVLPSSARLGRPQQYNHHELHAEITRMIYIDGLPETQAELIRKVQDLYQQKYQSEPATSTLKPIVSRVWKAVREGIDG